MNPRSSGTRIPKAVLYCRVSTGEQTTTNQRAELEQLANARGYETVEVIEETMSATKKRPGLDRVMKLAHEGACHVVVVWSLDRLGRSMVGNISTVLELDRLGVQVVSFREAWMQAEGPVRTLLIAIFGWVSEQERLQIVARTRAGLDRARREGRKLGRPGVEIDADKALLLRRRGLSLRAIAKKLGVGHSTLHRFFRAHDLRSRPPAHVPKPRPSTADIEHGIPRS